MLKRVSWLALIAALVVTVFPFYWMVRTAITPAADLFRDATRAVARRTRR